jgi:hypothetical protein
VWFFGFLVLFQLLHLKVVDDLKEGRGAAKPSVAY